MNDKETTAQYTDAFSGNAVQVTNPPSRLLNQTWNFSHLSLPSLTGRELKLYTLPTRAHN